MNHFHHLRRVGAFLSGAVIVSSCIDFAAFAAETQNTVVFDGDHFQVTYSVTNHWNSQYQSELSIRNTGDAVIQDWCLIYPNTMTIDQIWNGTADCYDTVALIHNCGYNQDIPVGGSVSVGMIETAEEMSLPKEFELISEPTLLANDAVKAEYSIVNDWESGYTAALQLTNLTDQVIEDWTIAFDYTQNIDTVWDAMLLNHEGNHYQLANAEYNQNIPANSSVTLYLQSQSSSKDASAPTNFVMYEYGQAKRNAIDQLMNGDRVAFDFSALNYYSEGYYMLKDEMHEIHGTIRKDLKPVSAEYSIENAFGTTLFSGSFEPAESWTISDIGFVIGLNKVSVSVAFADGTTTELTEWIGNFNEANMANVPLDLSDPDEDGLNNYLEEMYGTDPALADTDGDGLNDYQELTIIGTSPLKKDTDEDGIQDGLDDNDGDGIDTLTEFELGTNPLCVDTDSDYLSDYEELNTYHTSPLKQDTDGDGANDKWELDNGFDPLTFDKSFSSEVVVEGDTNSAEITVITKDGSAATLQASAVMDSPYLNTLMPGYMGSAFDFTMDGEFEKAVLKITFDPAYLNEQDLLPTIYYFNEETQQLEEIQTEWDGVSNYVTAELPHFSTYIVLNKTKFEQIFARDIELPNTQGGERAPFEFLFAIDCSGSMGPQGINNDPNNIRLAVSKEFVDELDDTDSAAVISFGENVTVLSDFTTNKENLKKAIDKVGNTDRYTYIGKAITKGLSMFGDPDGSVRYLVLLTDGKADDTLPSDYITTAKKKEVQIITIGLGHTIDASYLKNIAKVTDRKGGNGLYYYASTANDLNTSFSDMTEDVKKEDPYKDSNHDGITDAQTKAFCNGTLTTSTGMNPFLGLTYQEVQKNDDADGDGLKNGEEVQISKYTTNSKYVTMKTYPYDADSDWDGLDDATEVKRGTNPMRVDFYSGDTDYLFTDDIYLSSLMSQDYLENDWLKFQLFAGNILMNFNADYVDDYEVALSNYLYLANVTQSEYDALQIIKGSTLESIHLALAEIYANISILATYAEGSADIQAAIATLEKSALCLKNDRTVINCLHSLAEAEGSIDQYLQDITALEANALTMESRISKSNTLLANTWKADKLTSKIATFTTKLPPSVQNTMKFLNQNAKILYGASCAITTGLSIYSEVSALSCIYAEEMQYAKSAEMLHVIIDYSKNSDMRTAASNILFSLDKEWAQFANEAIVVLEDVVSGTARFLLTGGVEMNPIAVAVVAGLVIGDCLWNVSSIDQQSLYTIAMGDAACCLSAYVGAKMTTDASYYQHIADDNFCLISLLCQLRIVAENQFYDTAQCYSAIMDWVTDIKALSKETCANNIERIYNITQKYPNQLICQPNYEGASVTI